MSYRKEPKTVLVIDLFRKDTCNTTTTDPGHLTQVCIEGGQGGHDLSKKEKSGALKSRHLESISQTLRASPKPTSTPSDIHWRAKIGLPGKRGCPTSRFEGQPDALVVKVLPYPLLTSRHSGKVQHL